MTRWRRSCRRRGPGRVLITSQNPNWPPGQVLDVPVLDTEVAAGFLVSRTGDPDRAGCYRACGRAGRAAAGAGAGRRLHPGQPGTAWPATWHSFRQRRPELLARGEPTGYGSTVADHLVTGVRAAEQSAPQAAGLLRLLAFCAPEAIPLRLLLQPRPGLAEAARRVGRAGAEAAAGGPAGR